MNNFVILPHQLFETRHLDKKRYNYILWEHPHYFKDYNYNKKKLILHFSSMAYYYEHLKSKGFKVEYIQYDEKFNIQEYTLFDPVDEIKLTGKFTVIDSPNFMLSTELCEEYRKKTKNFFFNAFYNWSKKKLNIIPDINSLDKENRDRLPKGIKIPKVSSNRPDMVYIKEGVNIVNEQFSKNYGNCDDFMFPVTHSTAKRWLKEFVNYKLDNFGKYQDAVLQNDNTLFHSMLSTSINIGLLQPIDVVNEVLSSLTLKRKVPMNSLEGFIRQLFWREYQRYCYKYYNFNGKNYFGNTKKLTKEWYVGTTGILPVDNCIKKAFNTGYLHHIERLMIIGNYMNLYGVHPQEGFRWFMEFSCDSYEWVMKQNVLEMVFFVSGGDTMRRPYISSSNYILKMSDYKRGDWSDSWDDLYHRFLKKNKKKLWKFRYYFKGL